MSDRSRPTAAGLLRRCWPLLAAVPLGAVCGGLYAAVAPVQYQAEAYVMVVPEANGDSGTAVNFAQAYGRVIAQPEILLAAAADTGVPLAELTPLVQAVTSPDAPMVQITGSSGTAAKAAQEANAVARSLVAFGDAASKQTQVKLLVFASAAEPDAPSSPSRSLDVAVGAAAGVLIGGLGMMARRSGSAQGAPTALPTPRGDDSAGRHAAPSDPSDGQGADRPATDAIRPAADRAAGDPAAGDGATARPARARQAAAQERR
jgi:capsular polysaccharide biosynthesis protein